MDGKRLKEVLARFRDRKILVVGDYFLDGYWEVDRTKSQLSLETPWHVNQVVGQRYYPGAAGTVVNNLCSLGAGNVHCVGVIGKDAFADTLVTKLRERGADPEGLIRSDTSITQVYLKVMHHGYGEIIMEGPRFDFENQQPMSAEDEKTVLERVNMLVPKVDAVIIIEHLVRENYGVITGKVRQDLLALARKYDKIVFYADARKKIERYTDLVIKPNRFEAKKAVDPDWDGNEVDMDEAKRCGRDLAEKTGKPLYVTLGEKGLLVVDGNSADHVPGVKVDGKIDIVGAGDSVTAGLVLGLSVGATPLEAGIIGNLVGSITITKIGVTGTATPEEVIKRYEENPFPD